MDIVLLTTMKKFILEYELWILSLIVGLVVGLVIWGFVYAHNHPPRPLLLPVPPIKPHGTPPRPFDVFWQMMVMFWLTGWATQTVFSGRFFGVRALLNALAFPTVCFVALLWIAGAKGFYEGWQAIIVSLHSPIQTAVFHFMVFTIIVGLVWFNWCVFRLFYAFVRLSRRFARFCLEMKDNW